MWIWGGQTGSCPPLSPSRGLINAGPFITHGARPTLASNTDGLRRSVIMGVTMTQPWMKFYPADWRAEPRLRMCSLGARGLWIDLMAFMHDGEPYGYFLIDGKQPSTAETAALVGRPMGEVKRGAC